MARSPLFIACLLWSAFLTCGQESSQRSAKSETEHAINPIVDLVLIYDGGEGRQPWNVDRFRPYVYRETAGKSEWLFDGFLFIEYLARSGARLCPITRRKDANQQDWQELIEHYFQEGQSIGALNQLLDSLATKGHTPRRKRKVVITLPTPIVGSTPDQLQVSRPWGELDGRALDFLQTEDRFKAACWYVDTVLKRWQEKHYPHLELAGFYWVFERAWQVHHTREIGQYINAKGYYLYWIPSWPQGRPAWKQYGFDFVYQQPNYFFHRQPTPASRLEEACQFAEKCGTSMEMEFNQDLLSKPEFLLYFDEYLQAYSRHHVWEKKPVAYYEGAGAWWEMTQSHDAAVQRRTKALGDRVVQRQTAADAGFLFRQEAQ